MKKFIHEMTPADTLRVGDVVIRLLHKSGQRARIEVTAPDGATINKDAQECVVTGEHQHGKHAVRQLPKAIS